jgi:hypothetical protein
MNWDLYSNSGYLFLLHHFTYVKFAEFDVVEVNGVWSILYNGVNALNEFNAVDFAIGSCSPFSKHIFPYPAP